MVPLIDIIVVTLTIVTCILLGATVIINNPKQLVNRLFFLLSLFIAMWTATNYFTDHAGSLQASLFFARLAFASAFSVLIYLEFFIEELQKQTGRFFSPRKNVLHMIFLFIWALALSPFMITGATLTPHGVDLTTSSSYLLYLFAVLAVFIVIIRSLYAFQKSNDATKKTQGKIILWGCLFAFLFVLMTNIIAPAILNSWTTTKLGPLSTLTLLLVFFYAMLRHRLLGIRYFVFRATVYLLSVLLLASSFIVFGFYLTTLLPGYTPPPLYIELYYIMLLLVSMMTYEPLKKYLAGTTNKFFFQSGYSASATVNRISTFVTKNVDLQKIERFVLSTLDDTVRPNYAVFIFNNDKHRLLLSQSTGVIPTEILKSEAFKSSLLRIRHRVVFTDTQEVTTGLKQYAEAGSIGAITKLSTSNRLIGYIILGHKQNGNPYDQHDYRLLSLSSNDLALAIENAQRYEEIQAFNETLQNKVTEATKALRRTNKKLIALDDAKDEFISMASHQLRTPLTSVKGYISMLLEEDLGKLNEQQKQALKEAFDSSQRMVFLISDFLNVSRMRTGRFMIERQETDLAAIVEDEVKQLKDMAALRGQEITYKAPKNFPILMLDENKIRQVMMNMLDNAIFYTPRGGKISVVLQKTKDDVSYRVIDQGIGVPEKDQHRLFTKFFRAPNAQRARPDGTGLGLFMAQKIITEQKGEIIFQSKEGVGSTFGFRFPLAEVQPKVDR